MWATPGHLQWSAKPRKLDLSRQMTNEAFFQRSAGDFRVHLNLRWQNCVLHPFAVGKIVCNTPTPLPSAPSAGPGDQKRYKLILRRVVEKIMINAVPVKLHITP